MTKKPYDDSNWREEYKGYTSSRYELDILENGPRSLAQSWMLGALHNKWKKMKGITEPDPPDCQSSLKEWEAIAKKYENPPEAFGPGGPLMNPFHSWILESLQGYNTISEKSSSFCNAASSFINLAVML